MSSRIAIIFVLLFACLPAKAVELSRVLKTFDFEERGLGNDEDLPMNWSKVTGPGLPHYLKGQFATDRCRGGKYSFRFDLNGGSLIYRYAPGRIKVQQGARYRIAGYCQTTPLPLARARITAYFVDPSGRTIEQSVRHSDLFASPQDDGNWQELQVEMTADSPRADSIVVELEVLQPAQYAAMPGADHGVFEQDIHGSVWWDDITVSQVPAVALRTDHPANLFKRGEPVRLFMFISDRSTADLVGRLSIVNSDGKEVYQRTGRPDPLSRDPSGTSEWRMVRELPPLEPGAYRVILDMSSGGLPLISQEITVAVLGDTGDALSPDARFGFIATDLPCDAWDDLPVVLPVLSAGRVKLAVWSDTENVETSHSEAFDRLLERLQELRIAPSACLLALPPGTGQLLHSTPWAHLSQLKAGDWQPGLATLVSRHATHIERWQLGTDGGDAFATDPAMRAAYKQVLGAFSSLVYQPDLAVSWPAWYDLPPDAPAAVALGVPSSILPRQIPLYLQELKGRTDHDVSVTLQPLDEARYGREMRIRDLAQRVVYALSADAGGIDLPLPVRTQQDYRGLSIQPDELLIVLRTMTSILSGAKFKGKLAIADDVEALLFDRAGEGILVLWSREGAAATRSLSLDVGERPISIDLWGNAAPLPRAPGDQKGRLLLNLGRMPVFLVDIDGQQAQLRASVAMDQPLIESSYRPHERRIRFVNAYDHTITGSLHLKAPERWIIDPPTFDITLGPGQTFDRAVTIQFPNSSVAGPRTLQCQFALNDEKNPRFTVPLALKLGLSDVGMQTIALREGHDIFVQQEITNYGEQPISYTAFAMYPAQPRQERLAVNLMPGATTIRRYRFKNVPRDSNAPVRVGLQEMQGTRMLNDTVEVK